MLKTLNKEFRELTLSGMQSCIDFLKANKDQPIEQLIEALENIYKGMDIYK